MCFACAGGFRRSWPRIPTPPAGDAGAVLEVKWDEYLPDVIRDLVQTPSTCSAAFSKYAACRVYG